MIDNKICKILIICRAQSDEISFSRWKKLVSKYEDISITVIGDVNYEVEGWNKDIKRNTNEVYEERFRYIPVRFSNNYLWRGGYSAKGIFGIIRKIKPNFIYLIGTITCDVTLQTGLAKLFFSPKAKVAIFTMSGVNLPLRNLNFKVRFSLSKIIADAFFCHCPLTYNILRSQGKVKKPIYLQTQVGVPTEIFRSNKEKRIEIRKKYGIKENEYLFGSICRVDFRKGLFDVIKSLPINSNWKYMIIGSGPDFEKVKQEIIDRGLQDNFILTGYINSWEKVSNYINALDCSVLVSKRTSDWEDTFALAVAQSMAISKPVIVSNTGGLAYQVGEDGIIIEDGDIETLHSLMEDLSSNPEKGIKIGKKMYTRLLNSFSVDHLNKCFYYSVKDILNKQFNLNHFDQQSFKE